MAKGDGRDAKRAGCLPLLGFFVLEVAAGGFTAWVGYMIFSRLFAALGLTAEADFWDVVAVFLGLILAVIPIWWIDRWCKRVTGQSAADTFHLPF